MHLVVKCMRLCNSKLCLTTSTYVVIIALLKLLSLAPYFEAYHILILTLFQSPIDLECNYFLNFLCYEVWCVLNQSDYRFRLYGGAPKHSKHAIRKPMSEQSATDLYAYLAIHDSEVWSELQLATIVCVVRSLSYSHAAS